MNILDKIVEDIKLEVLKESRSIPISKLENQIKSEPRLWLWSHKRWKHTN